MSKQPTDPALIATLNDLLELDHDAVRAYTIAIDNLETAEHRETLESFRGDHERHIEELRHLIELNGGAPTDRAHAATGAFKAAVQQAGRAGGDRGILTAFKANERQVRDKYRRHAEESHEPEVDEVLRRAAADEEGHYAWAEKALEALGGSAGGRAADATEAGQARTADALEAAERAAGKAAERMGRSD